MPVRFLPKFRIGLLILPLFIPVCEKIVERFFGLKSGFSA